MERLKCLSYTRGDNCTSYETCAKPIDCPVGGPSMQHCYVVWEIVNKTTIPIATPASINVVNGGCMPSYDGRACGQGDCMGQHKEVHIRLNHSETPQHTSHDSFGTLKDNEYAPSYVSWIVVPVLLLLVLFMSSYIYWFRRKSNTAHKLVESKNNNNHIFNRRNKNMIGNLNDRELTEIRNNNDTSLLEPLRNHLGGEEHFFNNTNNNKISFNHLHSQHQHQQLIHNHNLVNTNALNTTYIKNNNDNRPDVSSTHTSSTLQVGIRLDLKNVQLCEVIGSGRFGTVHRAIVTSDKQTEMEVAVKIIAGSEHQSWSNEQQIYSLQRVVHQNILKFFHSEENLTTNNYWLIVEYASKGSLHNFLKKHTVNWKEFLHIALGIVHGLSHLHEADIAHRDFKSKNILLKDDLSACITDFGVADILDTTTRSQLDQRKKYLQVGTPRYMAPEVLECSVTFTKASFTKIDVYALSLVLWELLSRCYPLPTQDHESEPVPYKLPFEDIAGPNPDINEMRQIVVVDKMRPPIKEEWRAYSASEFCRAIEDGWEYDHDARISASCFVERVESLPKT